MTAFIFEIRRKWAPRWAERSASSRQQNTSAAPDKIFGIQVRNKSSFGFTTSKFRCIFFVQEIERPLLENPKRYSTNFRRTDEASIYFRAHNNDFRYRRRCR